MVYRLYDDLYFFPDPREGEPNGIFAIGGDLKPERLLQAYSQGIFPWFSFRNWDEPRWYCPMDRFVIFPDKIHVSHSMRTLMNKGIYEVSINKDFRGVIHGCAEKRIDMHGAWLGEDMIKAYTRLHEMGFAASVEVWEGDELIGGLYGVTVGSAFMGESMFSRKPGASKLALIYLARFMQERGGTMIDCQFETDHLRSMGGEMISYEHYLALLRRPTWLDGHLNK